MSPMMNMKRTLTWSGTSVTFVMQRKMIIWSMEWQGRACITRGSLPLSGTKLLLLTKYIFSHFVSYMDGWPNILDVDYASSLEGSVDNLISVQKIPNDESSFTILMVNNFVRNKLLSQSSSSDGAWGSPGGDNGTGLHTSITGVRGSIPQYCHSTWYIHSIYHQV